MVFNAAASPSGLVPGGGSGGRVFRSFFVDGKSVLDRVFAIFCEVLFVKVRDLVVIFFYFGVLLVLLRPPPF
jgi:hypothetical protein